MTKQYPPKGPLQFLLADDVREEVGGKSSFMGVYTGGAIIFGDPPEAGKVVAMPQLVFVVWFDGAHGEFDVRFQILDPTGAIRHDSTQHVVCPEEIERYHIY